MALGHEQLDVVAGIIQDDDRFLITQRSEASHLGGFWEFPGGKIEKGETQDEALKREILEELGVEITVGELFHEVEHEYADRHVQISFYFCSLSGSDTPEALECEQWKWSLPGEMKQLPFPPADSTLLEKLSALQRNG